MTNTISKLLIMLACSTCTTTIQAQLPNEKMGKPSVLEWKYAGWGDAVNASAIVLCKTMNVRYELTDAFGSYTSNNGNINDDPMQKLGKVAIDQSGIIVNYDINMRTKILKAEGASHANIDIVYCDPKSMQSGNSDEVSDLKVRVFTQNAKGKVEKRKVSATNFVTERLNDMYQVIHVAVPNAEPGSIIEYSYTIRSTRPTYLYDWTFRESIPVVHSKCEMTIPAMLQFNMHAPTDKLVKANVERTQLSYDENRLDQKAPKSILANHYTLTGDYILPTDKVAPLTSEITRMATLPEPLPRGTTHLKVK